MSKTFGVCGLKYTELIGDEERDGEMIIETKDIQ